MHLKSKYHIIIFLKHVDIYACAIQVSFEHVLAL